MTSAGTERMFISNLMIKKYKFEEFPVLLL